MSSERPNFMHRLVPGEREAHPPLLLLHGTGGDEDYMIPLGRVLSKGATLLSPRGKVVDKGKARFFRRLADGASDMEDLKLRSHELADFVELASVRYGLEPGKLFVVGVSNGADVAANLLLLRPGLLRGAILFRPMALLKLEVLPDLSGITVLVSAGLADRNVPKEQAKRLADILEKAGAEVCFRWRQTGHDLTLAEIKDAREWLSRQTSVNRSNNKR